jgi:peptide/nickel transport system substrate-binding protein
MLKSSLGKRGLVALISLTMTAVGAVGLAGSSEAAPKGKVLIVDNTFNLKTLDPGRMFEPSGNMIDRTIYSTLMTFKGNDASTPVPDLALSFKASADAKTFTYTLRKNATFSDGTKVTAKDVVFSLMRLKNLKGNPASLMDGVTATSTGAYTVILTSDTPNTAIPVIVASPSMGIVNSKVVAHQGGLSDVSASTGDKAESFLNTTSAGSGPYVLTKFSLTTEVVLTANPKYWGAKPGYSKIVIRNVLPNIQRLNVLKGVSNIAADLSPTQTEGMTNVKVLGGVGTTIWFLYSNANPKVSLVSSNKNFQEAVRYGLDYKSIVKLVGVGAIQAPGVIPSSFLGALQQSDAIKRDITRAKAALAKSTYKGEEIGLRYWGGGAWDGILFDDLATRIAAQLKEVGINIKLLPTPVGQALTTYRDGSDAMGLWFWGPDWPDSSNYSQNFGPGSKVGLRMGWAAGSNPIVENIVTKVAVESNPKKRAAEYRAFQLELNKDSPLMPFLQSPSVLVSTKNVKGLATNPIWKINLSELK